MYLLTVASSWVIWYRLCSAMSLERLDLSILLSSSMVMPRQAGQLQSKDCMSCRRWVPVTSMRRSSRA